jgi:hypothetical protein
MAPAHSAGGNTARLAPPAQAGIEQRPRAARPDGCADSELKSA